MIITTPSKFYPNPTNQQTTAHLFRSPVQIQWRGGRTHLWTTIAYYSWMAGELKPPYKSWIELSSLSFHFILSLELGMVLMSVCAPCVCVCVCVCVSCGASEFWKTARCNINIHPCLLDCFLRRYPRGFHIKPSQFLENECLEYHKWHQTRVFSSIEISVKGDIKL